MLKAIPLFNLVKCSHELVCLFVEGAMPYSGSEQSTPMPPSYNQSMKVFPEMAEGFLPEQPYPGQQYPGQPYPGQQYLGQPYPGQQYPGQPYPGQPYPGQPYPGQYPEPVANVRQTVTVVQVCKREHFICTYLCFIREVANLFQMWEWKINLQANLFIYLFVMNLEKQALC